MTGESPTAAEQCCRWRQAVWNAQEAEECCTWRRVGRTGPEAEEGCLWRMGGRGRRQSSAVFGGRRL